MVTRAKEIMQKDVLTIPVSSDALACARRMVEHRQGYAVLTDGTGPVGIVTEWDYLEKIVSAGVDPARTPLPAIASRPVVACAAESPTSEVVQLMGEKGIRRIVVTEGSRVVGVITARDVIRIFREYVDKVSADIARLQPTLG